MKLLNVFEMIASSHSKKLTAHKMIKHTLTIWQRLLKDLYEVYNMTLLRILDCKGLTFENI